MLPVKQTSFKKLSVWLMVGGIICAWSGPEGAYGWSAGGMTNAGAVAVTQDKKSRGQKWVKARVLVNAPPSIVWKAVHEERQHDPDLCYSKVVSQISDNEYILEQKFASVPIVGTAVCRMSNIEYPLERIDYRLINSDRFKSMEGSWVLTPSDNGEKTTLELSTYVDLRLPVSRLFINRSTSTKLQRRLERVKLMAEMH